MVVEVAFEVTVGGQVEAFDWLFGFDSVLQPEFVLRIGPAGIVLPGVGECLGSLFGALGMWTSLCSNPDRSRVEVLSGDTSRVTIEVLDESGGGTLLGLVFA